MRHSESTACDDLSAERLAYEPARPEQETWHVLSPEVALGFGGMAFLRTMVAEGVRPKGVAMLFAVDRRLRLASLHIVEVATARETLERLDPAHAVLCIATREFMDSLGFGGVTLSDRRGYFQTPEMRLLMEAALAVPFTGRAAGIYRAAKGMELVCESLCRRAEATLVPLGARGELSMADSVRIAAARDLISERFREKLTLHGIGRACGINRAKLTRGFREMFHCSIADTIAEHRLTYAGRQLTGSDRAISLIGYDAGYLNNASFARSFHRRFNCTPSEFRRRARLLQSRAEGLLAAA